MSNLPSTFKKSKNRAASPQEGRTWVSRPSLMVSTGLDKLEVSLHLEIGDPELFYRFRSFKSEMQEGFSKSRAFPWRGETTDFTSFAMQRMGNKFFPYIFKSGDITLMLANRDSSSRIPNCQIEIGSLSSQLDGFNIYRELLEWLQSYHFKVVKETVARADLAADFVSVDIKELNIDNKHRWVTRGRKFITYCEDWDLTGVMIGKGNCALRIYDKALEVSTNKVKSEFFHNKWNCEEGENVTRVEFQLRREVLKEFVIPVNTVAELERNLESVWNYCCRKWARHTCEDVDRANDNQDRAATSIFWKMAQDASFHPPVKNHLINRRYKEQLHKNVKQLLEQARGCLLSVAAACGHSKDDFFGILETVRDSIGNEFAEYMSKSKGKFEKLFEARIQECYVGF